MNNYPPINDETLYLLEYELGNVGFVYVTVEELGGLLTRIERLKTEVANYRTDCLLYREAINTALGLSDDTAGIKHLLETTLELEQE